MLGVSLFISCKNKIQCVCVCEKKTEQKQKIELKWAKYMNRHFTEEVTEMKKSSRRDVQHY